MFRKLVLLVLLVSILVCLAGSAYARPSFVPPGLAKKMEPKDLVFSDSGEAAWALQYMARLKARGIIKGYEDGTFRPSSSVSQAEAVSMVVRMKSAEAEQQALELSNTPLPIPGIAASWWATGYIQHALQSGWISLEDFAPNAAAKRVWVAKLLVRALISNWELEVAARAGVVLTFSDAHRITAQDAPYVALAVERGWIHGYPDGQFQPDKPVTRAEMAALLDRSEGSTPGPNPYEIRGTLEAVDVTLRKITVLSGGASLQYSVSQDALIFVDGTYNVVSLAHLSPGDSVNLILNQDGVVILLSAEAGPGQKVSGTVVATAFDATPKSLVVVSGGTTLAYVLAADCKLYYQNQEVALSLLVPNDKVELSIYNNAVVRIKITEKTGVVPPHGHQVTGTIHAIAPSASGTALSVKTSAGVLHTYELKPDCQVRVQDTLVDRSLLSTGIEVRITVVDNLIAFIEVLPKQIEGTVTAVDLAATPRTLSVDQNVYKLSADAKAYYTNSVVPLSTISVNDKVSMVRYIDVTAVTITQKHSAAVSITGNIHALTVSAATYTMTVRTAAGIDHVYDLSNSAEVRSGTLLLSRLDLRVGLPVTVSVSGGLITAVEVLAREVSGTVSAIDLASSPKSISIVTTGATSVYPLMPDVKVYHNAVLVPLTSIQLNDSVQLTCIVDSVTEILITHKSGSVSGTITGIVSSGGIASLTLVSSTGVNYTYPLASSAEVWVEDALVTVSELTAGIKAKLTLVNAEITLVEVLEQKHSGTVTSMALDTRKISVLSESATKQYTLSAECKAYYANEEVALSSIVPGDKVELSRFIDVFSIVITQKHAVLSGVLEAVSVSAQGTTLSVRDSLDTLHTHLLTDGAQITHNGAATTVDELAIGSQVTLTLVDGEITAVEME